MTPHTTWTLAVIFSTGAGWLDWRTRRIPNWLTLSGFAVGLAANTMAGGWPGAKASLAGAGLAFGLLLPAVLLHGLGAGDWKLLGSLGAILGWAQFLMVLVVTLFVAGTLAVGQMVRQKRVRETLSNLWEIIRGVFIFGLKPHPEINLDNPAAATLPFGVAVAAAAILCFGAAAMGL